MDAAFILNDLQAMANPAFKKGLGRFGIVHKKALGIKIPDLQKYARLIQQNHELALQLWQTSVHEARLLAVFIAEPKKVTEELMEQWVQDFNSWDICDQTCGVLFDKTPFAYQKAMDWAQREPEYQKRAGFTLMATLAIHNKKAADASFVPFFSSIERAAADNRNFVKKAVNWALRQIGKRNLALNEMAIATAQNIQLQHSKSARWIAADALRELQSDKVQARLSKVALK